MKNFKRTKPRVRFTFEKRFKNSTTTQFLDSKNDTHQTLAVPSAPLMGKTPAFPLHNKTTETHLCIILFYNVNNHLDVSGDGVAAVVEDLVHEERHMSQLRI